MKALLFEFNDDSYAKEIREVVKIYIKDFTIKNKKKLILIDEREDERAIDNHEKIKAFKEGNAEYYEKLKEQYLEKENAKCNGAGDCRCVVF